jgi:ABC-2 type transport system ATP-binding protein
LEQNPHRVAFLIPKEQCGEVIARTLRDYAPKDISVEEEDIGSVVERIYGAGGSGMAPAGAL